MAATKDALNTSIDFYSGDNLYFKVNYEINNGKNTSSQTLYILQVETHIIQWFRDKCCNGNAGKIFIYPRSVNV